MDYIDNCKECMNFFVNYSNQKDHVKISCSKEMFNKQEIPYSEYEEFSETERDCKEFKARHIRYPITVENINYDNCNGYIPNGLGTNTGDLVKIRPCGEEYNNKTYLGIFIGEIGIQPYVSYDQDKQLNINLMHNPMIYIPDLKKCVFGYESWWSKIENEDELSDITENDINNTWYVKLAKELNL